AEAVGRGRGSWRSRRSRRRRRPAAAALRPRAASDRAAARLRARRPAAPCPARPPLRRRPHGVLSLFLAARGRSVATVLRIPARRRLDRVLVARVLARIPRPDRGARGLGGPEAVPEDSAAGVLLLEAVRTEAARGGHPQPGGHARGPVRGRAGRRAAPS